MLRVAVVGSGPAGLYTAEALVKQAAALSAGVQVDVIDRLPTPYGLVRYGVAPDHKSIKSIAQYLRKVLESPGVSFLGGVRLGLDVTRAELLDAYDAVVYATGAMRDRRLGIPGEDLPGSVAATDFVNWYCGHPDVSPDAFTLDAESVAVIGVGNVAVDVARILARDPAELHDTDIPEPVLAALHASKVREVHMIGRRGPAHAKFTTKELRELGELPGVRVVVEPGDLVLSASDEALAESDRRVRGNMVALRSWKSSSPAGDGRTLTLRFWLRPVSIEGPSRVSSLVLERTGLSESGRVVGTGESVSLEAQLVLRSVGYQSVPLPDVPFDEGSCTVPNVSGRVVDSSGAALPGEYVAGWLKRGPTGVIGTNKSDAAETVRALLADLAGGPGPSDAPLPRAGLLRLPSGGGSPTSGSPAPGSAAPGSAAPGSAAPGSAAPGSGSPLDELLATRGVRPVSYDEWLRIEEAETSLARSLGRGERVKLADSTAIWSACRPS
jgi:ferredoxin--NADP+ reductase